MCVHACVCAHACVCMCVCVFVCGTSAVVHILELCWAEEVSVSYDCEATGSLLLRKEMSLVCTGSPDFDFIL